MRKSTTLIVAAKRNTKNLFDKSLGFRNGYFVNDNGVETGNGNFFYGLHFIPVKPYTVYTASNVGYGTNSKCGFYFYDVNKNFISRNAAISNRGIFTSITPQNCAFVRVQGIQASGNGIISADKDRIQFEEGNVATEYEPYSY